MSYADGNAQKLTRSFCEAIRKKVLSRANYQ